MTPTHNLINDWLPAEMLERVFRMLPPRDLRTVVLVCRRWKEVAEKPFLWSWVSLAVDTTNLAHMPGLLRGRLLRVTEMRARVASEELLHTVASHPALRALDISDTPLPRIDADLLASSITGRLTKLVIWETHLTTDQAEALLTRLAITHQLRSLDISYNDLSEVEPQLLARAVVELEELRLSGTSLTSEQSEALFYALNEADNWLDCLHISYCNLSTIDPAHLTKVLLRLQEVSVMYSSLTPLQLDSLFLSIIHGSSLVTVDLSYNDLSSVDPEILAEAINKLESVTMNRTCVTCDQVKMTKEENITVSDDPPSTLKA